MVMKTYGDPLAEMCRIDGFFSDIYEDAHLQNLTVGTPKLGNLQQIHNEIIKKLECMAHTHQRNTCISGYPIPFCCEPATLYKMYTMEELCIAGIVTISTNLEGSHVGTRWPARSEFEESHITDTKGIHDTVEESTDTEMAHHASATLMITSDREKIQLEALAKEQDWAMSRSLRQVQEQHLEVMHATASSTHS